MPTKKVRRDVADNISAAKCAGGGDGAGWSRDNIMELATLLVGVPTIIGSLIGIIVVIRKCYKRHHQLGMLLSVADIVIVGYFDLVAYAGSGWMDYGVISERDIQQRQLGFRRKNYGLVRTTADLGYLKNP